jgi:hypothetical protein
MSNKLTVTVTMTVTVTVTVTVTMTVTVTVGGDRMTLLSDKLTVWHKVHHEKSKV